MKDLQVKQTGGSGKQRTKAEQVEHKHAHPEGDTRRIIANVLHGEERRKEENLTKHPATATATTTASDEPKNFKK